MSFHVFLHWVPRLERAILKTPHVFPLHPCSPLTFIFLLLLFHSSLCQVMTTSTISCNLHLWSMVWAVSLFIKGTFRPNHTKPKCSSVMTQPLFKFFFFFLFVLWHLLFLSSTPGSAKASFQSSSAVSLLKKLQGFFLMTHPINQRGNAAFFLQHMAQANQTVAVFCFPW